MSPTGVAQVFQGSLLAGKVIAGGGEQRTRFTAELGPVV